MLVLFTSINSNQVDRYNIYQILKNFDHKFIKIVCINSTKTSKSNILKIKEFIKQDLWTLYRENVLSKLLTKSEDKFIEKLMTDNLVNFSCNSLEMKNYLTELKPSLMIQCGGSTEKLDSSIFSIPSFGTINIHHGLAPEIRGVYSIFWPLYFGWHEKLGVTCHFIDSGFDTGPVIYTYTPNYKIDDFKSLYRDLILNGSKMLNNAIEKIVFQKHQFEIKEDSEIESYYFSYNDFNKVNGHSEFKKIIKAKFNYNSQNIIGKKRVINSKRVTFKNE